VSEFKQTEVGVDLTRREWLLKLSQLLGIAGVSGVVPELAPALPDAAGQETRALPPGLYYPSQEHLSHALGDLGSWHSIPPGSETDYLKPSSSPFRPQFFSDEELPVVTRFAEILLGKVDSEALAQSVQWLDSYLYSQVGVRQAALNLDPLHRALAVAYYGESAVRELETGDPQTVVRSGIAALEQLSLEQYGQEFLRIDPSQQSKIITTISAAQPDSSLRGFFEATRAEIVRGYYTSAEGLKELDYKGNWYYAACPGCETRRPPSK
jgi:Gluconate 2-dehydrogenase subunit 3